VRLLFWKRFYLSKRHTTKRRRRSNQKYLIWLRFFENNDRISKGCVVDAWLNKAAETKWLAKNLLGSTLLKNRDANGNNSHYLTFTRTTYTV